MKSKYLEYGGKLLIVCAVCMLGVGGAYVMARQRIEEGKKAALLGSLKEVLMLAPDAAEPEVHPATKDAAKDEDKVYFAKSAEHGKLYAAQGGQQGYSSVVRVAVGAKALESGDLKIVAVRVVSQAETPGLGTRIAEQSTNLNFWTWIGNMFGAGVEERTWYGFLEQYSELDLDEIVNMTGVTISSNAVTESVRKALEKIRRVTGGND